MWQDNDFLTQTLRTVLSNNLSGTDIDRFTEETGSGKEAARIIVNMNRTNLNTTTKLDVWSHHTLS